jgi:hypothetical protein
MGNNSVNIKKVLSEGVENKKALLQRNKACGDEWIRTTDSRIFSPMLYQLSYITVVM